MLTHNRAGVLGAILSVGTIVIGSARSPMHLLKSVAVFLVVAILVGLVINFFFPDVWTAYQALLRIGEVASTNKFQDESDELRIVFAQHTLVSLLSNPIGHGYSLLSGVPGYEKDLLDPHGIFSQVIWGGGLFGLTWFLIFGTRAVVQSFHLIRSNRSKETTHQLSLVLIGTMLAFMLTGMAHTIISTGMAWILFGALLRLLRNSTGKSSDPASHGGTGDQHYQSQRNRL